MNRALAILCALAALTTPACTYRESKPTTPEGERLGAAHQRVYDPTSGESFELKTTDNGDGTRTSNVIIDQTPDGGIVVGAISGPGASGAARSGNPVAVAGSDGTNARDLLTDTSGNLRNKPVNTSGSIMTGVTSASDQTSSAVDVRGYANVCVWITMANTSTPVGAFSILGSNDNTNFNTVHLAADGVIGANFTGAYTSTTGYAGGYSVAVSSPSGTVVVQACITNTTPYFKVFWDNTSGGAVTTINAGYFAYN